MHRLTWREDGRGAAFVATRPDSSTVIVWRAYRRALTILPFLLMRRSNRTAAFFLAYHE